MAGVVLEASTGQLSGGISRQVPATEIAFLGAMRDDLSSATPALSLEFVPNLATFFNLMHSGGWKDMAPEARQEKLKKKLNSVMSSWEKFRDFLDKLLGPLSEQQQRRKMLDDIRQWLKEPTEIPSDREIFKRQNFKNLGPRDLTIETRQELVVSYYTKDDEVKQGYMQALSKPELTSLRNDRSAMLPILEALLTEDQLSQAKRMSENAMEVYAYSLLKDVALGDRDRLEDFVPRLSNSNVFSDPDAVRRLDRECFHEVRNWAKLHTREPENIGYAFPTEWRTIYPIMTIDVNGWWRENLRDIYSMVGE